MIKTYKINIIEEKLTEKCLTIEPGDSRELYWYVIDQHLFFAHRDI